MKTHTKTTLQKLVFEDMNPQSGVMNQDEISNWLTQLPKITAEMIDTIRLIMFANLSTKMICRYYRQIHMECTATLDRLYHYPSFPDSMLLLFQQVLHCLESVLAYMHDYHQKYLDPKARMPVIQYKKVATQIEAGIDVMVAAMMKCNIDKTLQALVVGKMARLLADGSASYTKVKALADLQGRIVELCKTKVQVNDTSRLYGLLLRTNFNTSGFIAYSMAKIDRELAEIYKVEQQYFFLYEREREFSRLIYKNGAMKFDPALDGLKSLMLNYVRTELAYLDKQHKKNPASDNPIVGTRQNDEIENQKVKVSFSVDALAYFFKLLVKAGAIEEGSKSKLLLLLAKYFQTPGIGNGTISINSINTKYKQVVQTTAKGVRAVLVRMLKLLDEEFDFA